MVKRFCFVVTAFIAIVSCSKTASDGQNEVPVREAGELVPVKISVAYEDGLKSTLKGLSPEWVASDKVSLFGASSTNAELTLVSSTGKSAVFSGNAEASGPWTAVYPYSNENAVSGGVVTVDIPSSQVVPASGCVSDGALVAVGTTDDLGKGLALKNVTSLLKVTLAIDQADMDKIIIRSNDGSALTGKVKVKASTGEITQVEDGSDTVVLTSATGTFQGGNYYIAVIPGEHSGITVDFTRVSDARKAEKISENSLKTLRSNVVNLGGFDDYTLEWEYLIDSYEDMIEYSKDVENWVVGEDVELRTDLDMKSIPWAPLTFTQGGGTFKGNGHKIYNLVIDPDPSVRHCGFFGQYYKSIDNIVFGSKDGKTWDGVSRICCNNSDKSSFGYAAPITFPKKNISNIVNFCKVSIPAKCLSKSRCGGICAFVEEDGVSIVNCTNYGDIETFTTGNGAEQTCVGGIAGGIAHKSGLLIDNCVNYGNITSHNKYTYGIGGILGEKYSKGSNTSVKNCVNYGDVKHISDGNNQNSILCIAGIVGQFAMNVGYTDCVIENCHNHGDVFSSAITTSQHVGGVCGRMLGGSIRDCSNDGTVEENFELAVSFTALGGIVGYVYSGFADNYVENNTNKGLVKGVTYSIGFENKNDGIFHGTAAGGIVGICAAAQSVSRNNNYGAVDFTTMRKGRSPYDAVAEAGGILGYDKGKTELFSNNHNYPSATVKAVATNTSSGALEEICAGGIVGKLMFTTMEVGINEADVSAVKAASGVAYAGSIAGVNNSTIATCYYAGKVNGATADMTNTVGNGNKPQVAAPVKEVFDYDNNLDDLGSEDVDWD